MFFSIIKWVLISLTLIFLVHHLYMFLMNTLTVPKIKDLVNKPTQQYQDMLGGNAPPPPLYGSNEKMGGGSHPTMGGQGGSPPLSDELSSFLNDLKKNSIGPGSLGPNTVGPATSADKFPSTLGSAGGEMGYSLY
jgi:hypothetical protein